MMLKIQSFNYMPFPLIVLLISAVIFPIHGLDSRKLDETPVPGPVGEKCTTLCVTSPPPPPPPSPPPACPPPPPPPSPPPACPPPPPPALPPPSPKKPPSGYCSPPPPSFIYFTGSQGNLYPITDEFGSAGRASAVGWSVLIGRGILGLLVILGF